MSRALDPFGKSNLIIQEIKAGFGTIRAIQEAVSCSKTKMSFVVCEWSNNFQFNVLTPMPCLRNILLLPRWSAHWTNSITMALRWTMGRL